MLKWDYLKVDINHPLHKATDVDLLGKAGGEGWELVVITANSIAYLKRPISKPRSRQKA
jgi:hypothetical protein